MIGVAVLVLAVAALLLLAARLKGRRASPPSGSVLRVDPERDTALAWLIIDIDSEVWENAADFLSEDMGGHSITFVDGTLGRAPRNVGYHTLRIAFDDEETAHEAVEALREKFAEHARYLKSGEVVLDPLVTRGPAPELDER